MHLTKTAIKDGGDSTPESIRGSRHPRQSLLANGCVISLLPGLGLWSGGKSLDQAINPTVSASAVATSATAERGQIEPPTLTWVWGNDIVLPSKCQRFLVWG